MVMFIFSLEEAFSSSLEFYDGFLRILLRSFMVHYGLKFYFFGFAGFPASLDGLANATAMVLSSSLWFLGWL